MGLRRSSSKEKGGEREADTALLHRLGAGAGGAAPRTLRVLRVHVLESGVTRGWG